MAVQERTRRVAERQETEEQDVPLWKCLVAEFIGTFFLTFVSAAPIVFDRITGGELQNVDKVVPAGALVAAMIYTVGPLSGAHFNPAVTLAFTLRKAFPWTQAVPYIITEFLGAFAAGGLLLGLFGNVANLGSNVPHGGVMQAFVLEIVFTFLLVMVILGTSKQHKIAGPNAALAVGMTIALCGLVGGVTSGGSMNPARSLGPAIVSGYFNDQWLYLAGPLLGSALAVLVTTLLHGWPNSEEHKAAMGEKRAD